MKEKKELYRRVAVLMDIMELHESLGSMLVVDDDLLNTARQRPSSVQSQSFFMFLFLLGSPSAQHLNKSII